MPMHDLHDLQNLCATAALNAGASNNVAQTLAEAVIAAELRGRPAVGLTHFFDFLHGLATGSINGSAVPEIVHQGSTVWADARGGIPHTAFNLANSLVSEIARKQGCAIFMQSNSYTCGELGYFTDQFAQDGLLALAAASSPALLAPGGSLHPVLGTNPMSMAAPLDEGAPFLIDQAASQVAYVSIREAAHDGRILPDGWAVDAVGKPTTNAQAALDGALLPFGGHKGGNLALMAEILAGMAGGNWSLDAPSFLDEERTPGIGMFMLVVDPTFRDQGFPRRLRVHLERLQQKYGVWIPGRRRTGRDSTDHQQVQVSPQLHERLLVAAGKQRT